MSAFSDRARFAIFFAVLLVSGQVARLLPLTEGWTILAGAALAGVLGLVVDQWGKRRGPGGRSRRV